MGTRYKILFLIISLFIIINYAVNVFLSPVEVSYEGINEELSLSDDVEVLFDDYGVPSIFAVSDSDMFKVAGYLGARDRLFQMAFLKYAYKGQLSAVVNDTLFTEDRFLRTLGFEKIAQKTLNKVPSDILAHLEDTCYGINAYVQSLSPSEYPLEFKLLQIDELPTFEPLDIVALSTMMAWELQGGWDSELFFGAINEQLGPDYLSEILPSYDPNFVTISSNDVLLKSFKQYASDTENLRNLLKTDRDGYGSNAWAVSGTKTKSGKPLLANDPHLAYNLPPWWYEIRLKSNNYNFGGYGLYGIPLPVIGHNENIGWGFTNVMTDDMDFYIESLNEDQTQYYVDGEWRDLMIEEEELVLKSGSKRKIIIRSTHRGPIISEIHRDAKALNKAISFRWTEFDAFDETTGLFMLAKAKNWEDFNEASKVFGAPGQNWTYADKEGNIGWRPSTKIPIRLDADKLVPFDGTTTKYDWQGYIPFDEMPFSFNPEKGYISNGNNKIVGNEYPYYISRYWADPSRATQIKTVKKETLNDIVNKSFEDAFIFLKDKYGNPSELIWGDVHQVTYEHNLDADPLVQRLINFSVGPFPMAGSEMTPRAASYSVSRPFDVRAGSSMRRIIDFSDFDNGFSILPTGQSGLFRSKHYRDQTEMYNRGEFKPFMFTYDAINSSKSSKLVFKSK